MDNMNIILDRLIASTVDPRKLINLLTSRMVRTIDPAIRIAIKRQIADLIKELPNTPNL